MSAFFGLDIGSNSVKLIELSGSSVTSIGIAANPTGRVGLDLVPAELSALSMVVKGLIDSSKVKSHNVVVGVPESAVFTRILTFPYMSTPELATAIRWEVEQTIPYPIDKLELSWEVMYKPKSAVGGEKMRVYVVAVPGKISSGMVSFMDNIGYEVIRMENEGLSLIRSNLDGKGELEVNVMVDVGFSNTKMLIADANEVYASYVSPVAGLAFTKIISDSFKLPPVQAEEYKRTYGLDGTQLEGKLLASAQPILNTLIADVKKVISSYTNSYPERKIERILLNGGGSYLKGLLSILVHQTGLEVIMGDCFAKKKIKQEFSSMGAVFGVAMGLGMEVR